MGINYWYHGNMMTDWWFGTWFLWLSIYCIGNVIISTDELIFFRGVETTNQTSIGKFDQHTWWFIVDDGHSLWWWCPRSLAKLVYTATLSPKRHHDISFFQVQENSTWFCIPATKLYYNQVICTHLCLLVGLSLPKNYRYTYSKPSYWSIGSYVGQLNQRTGTPPCNSEVAIHDCWFYTKIFSLLVAQTSIH